MLSHDGHLEEKTCTVSVTFCVCCMARHASAKHRPMHAQLLVGYPERRPQQQACGNSAGAAGRRPLLCLQHERPVNTGLAQTIQVLLGFLLPTDSVHLLAATAGASSLMGRKCCKLRFSSEMYCPLEHDGFRCHLLHNLSGGSHSCPGMHAQAALRATCRSPFIAPLLAGIPDKVDRPELLQGFR